MLRVEVKLKQEEDAPATACFKGILNKNHVRLRKAGPLVEKLRLDAAELAYHRVLGGAKKLYSGLSDPTRKTVYERDHTKNWGNLDLLHSFITPTFYFQLRCDYDFIAWIDYYFCDCPFEDELKRLLNEGGIVTMIQEKVFDTHYPEFYQGVLAYQHEKFICVL